MSRVPLGLGQGGLVGYVSSAISQQVAWQDTQVTESTQFLSAQKCHSQVSASLMAHYQCLSNFTSMILEVTGGGGDVRDFFVCLVPLFLVLTRLFSYSKQNY